MYQILITTTDREDIGIKMSKHILQEKLSPCVQIIKNIDSHYIWNNKIENAKEYMLLIKCRKKNLDKIKIFIQKQHNYDIPELIAFDIKLLDEKYQSWFNQNSI